MSTSITGLEGILSNLKGLEAQVKTELKPMFSDTAHAILTDAQNEAPVAPASVPGSGELRDSGHVTETDTGNKVTYLVTFGDERGIAWFNELGTYKMAAHPFLGPSFSQHTEELASELKSLS